jgi:hypothetical protein
VHESVDRQELSLALLLDRHDENSPASSEEWQWQSFKFIKQSETDQTEFVKQSTLNLEKIDFNCRQQVH